MIVSILVPILSPLSLQLCHDEVSVPVPGATTTTSLTQSMCRKGFGPSATLPPPSQVWGSSPRALSSRGWHTPLRPQLQLFLSQSLDGVASPVPRKASPAASPATCLVVIPSASRQTVVYRAPLRHHPCSPKGHLWTFPGARRWAACFLRHVPSDPTNCPLARWTS